MKFPSLNICSFGLLLLALTTISSQAAVLPEDRADILYHAFDGGGADISGPSVLVRKNIADKVSLSGSYYVDMVSSASIDVIATASPYEEERDQYSAAIDYLNGKSLMSLSYTKSSESDYDAETWAIGISQDFFGDLTTIGIGFSVGNDTVNRNIKQPDGSTITDPDFEDEAQHRRYSFSISQILTKSLIATLAFETVTDEGYLNNPYRTVRYRDNSPQGYSYEQELYPRTRNSDAIALRAMYYLPYRAALKGEYRTYTDSWGIDADIAELKYVHPVGSWKFEAKVRAYKQNQADFYSDLFEFSEATTYRARDKELSEFSDISFGLGVTYELPGGWLDVFEKSTINLYWDHFQFDYDNFRDVTAGGDAGEEPLYSFDADVIRLYFSVWY
jgi:hypothetical protein